MLFILPIFFRAFSLALEQYSDNLSAREVPLRSLKCTGAKLQQTRNTAKIVCIIISVVIM